MQPYFVISIILFLFIVGTSSILFSMIFEVPQYNLPVIKKRAITDDIIVDDDLFVDDEEI